MNLPLIEDSPKTTPKILNYLSRFFSFFCRKFAFKFIFNTTAAKEEAKIANSIHKSSNIRTREAISLSEIFIACGS
jgi:hypothetical protein